MSYSFWNKKNKQYQNIDFNTNDKWKDLSKTLNNKAFDCIWKNIDNGDGKISQEEIVIFDYFCKYLNKKEINEEDCDKITELFKGDYINACINRIKEKIRTNKNNVTPWIEKNYFWSEGIERNITEIKIGSSSKSKILYEELKKIGETVGFNVKIVEKYAQGEEFNNTWMEDLYIRRADGKIYVLPNLNEDIKNDIDIDFSYKQKFIKNNAVSQNYKVIFPNKELVQGKSYLEGGNVINTCLQDGTPGAIIGESSIIYSLRMMQLEDTEANRIIVKQQIAKDLGLNPNNITYIPQFDFHIDMYYKPLANGEIIIPDMEEGFRILQESKLQELDTEEKEYYINNLLKMNKETKETRKNAETLLIKQGYKIKKMPCFGNKLLINYLNCICGTDKNGKPYVITNKSEYPELDTKIIKYFDNIGIKDIYFISTQHYLNFSGGIDCLTQEL